jgi:hypothetical protein
MAKPLKAKKLSNALHVDRALEPFVHEENHPRLPYSLEISLSRPLMRAYKHILLRSTLSVFTSSATKQARRKE